jgi:predicted RNA binding protein YcfA (HicA-like mRNA interferase family)
MVAIIRSARSAKRSCHYNESKVALGQANCIMAGNYPCEAQDLTARQRMLVLQKRLDLNARCYKGCLHIVLSFHPDDRLTPQQLRKISQAYMDHIGLGEQPFLVYQHLDTLHPHLHLVAVTVKADGSGNSVFHAREAAAKNTLKQIEKDYHLTASVGREILPANLESAQKLQYGKLPATLGIAQVLSVVLPFFKYCTITELNAVLRHYNVVAKTGRPGSVVRLHQGLSYQMLSDQGRQIGSPIKASRLAGKPTLTYLNERFKANSMLIASYQRRLKTLIDLALIDPGTRSLTDLGQYLSREAVKTVYAFTPAGELSEIILVDFGSRSVVSASQLGERYTASRLQKHFEEFENTLQTASAIYQNALPKPLVPTQATKTSSGQDSEKQVGGRPTADESLLKLLLDPGPIAGHLPWELKKRLRKKRRQISLQL